MTVLQVEVLVCAAVFEVNEGLARLQIALLLL